MKAGPASPLLGPSDGPAFAVTNPAGRGPFVLVCEHASPRVPEALENLGLDERQILTHVGWDPGAGVLARLLAAAWDAPLLLGRFSRLVHDCNRPPEAASAMPGITEVCAVPGNQNLSRDEVRARVEEIYRPFHRELRRLLQDAGSREHPPILISVHSFTPVFQGKPRAVEIGLLHGANGTLAEAVRARLQETSTFEVRCNEPYAPEDGVLHTFEKHIQLSDPHLMIEVRNDLLATPDQIAEIENLLADALPSARDALTASSSPLTETPHA